MLPVAEHIEGDIYRVYFGGRTFDNISHIGCMDVDITDPRKYEIQLEPILGPGELGTFDDCGVCPLWIETDKDYGDTYLYYMGWHRDGVVRASEMTGCIMLDPQVSGRSRIPAFPLTHYEPFSVLVLTCKADGMAYYDGCDGWLSPEMPKYNIKSCPDYLMHTRMIDRQVAIDYEEDETRVSCARVIGDEMWFCSAKQEGYSMKYAIRQGGKWVRKPIEIPRQDWDSEMQCYPFPIVHNGRRYLLFNGNGYGRTGFGYATEE